MAEKEYIERASIYSAVKRHTNPYGKPTLDYESGVKVLDMIKQEPAADVVEVVRCKDCVDYKCDTPYCQKHKKSYCDRDGAIKPENHYCGFGKRKEETP